MVVDDGVNDVPDDAEDVETGEDGLGEVDVLCEGHGGVVAAADRVGGRDDAAPRLQRSHDARLRHRDRLLLHRLVDGCAVLLGKELGC